MATWGFDGVLNHDETVDSNLYIGFLCEMGRYFQEQVNLLRFENMSLIHDNAHLHSSISTTAFLESKSANLIRQPPYSPDCNLCDRFIFLYLESIRKRTDFVGKEDAEQFLLLQLLRCREL